MKAPRTPEYVSEVLEIPLSQIEWDEPTPAERRQRHPLPEELRKNRKAWWKQRRKLERQRQKKEN